MGEKKKSRKTGALRTKSLFTGPKSLLLQCIQLAYIATKTSKITKINKSNKLLQGQNGKKSKEEQKGKTSNGQPEQCVRSEQCAGRMNNATCEISQPAKLHEAPISWHFLLFFPSSL